MGTPVRRRRNQFLTVSRESRDHQQHYVLLRIVLLVPLLLGSTIKGEAVREDQVFLTAAHQENKPFASFLQTEERHASALLSPSWARG